MSFDMFVFDDGNFYPDEISGSNFLSDSSIESLLQEISDDQNHVNNNNNNNNNKSEISAQIVADEAQSLDQITHVLFSDSPPSHEFDTLSLQQQQQEQQNHFGNLTHLTNSTSLGNVYTTENYSGFPEVKTEEFHPSFDYSSPTYKSYFLNGGESMLKFMQRSYSSNCFEGKPGFLPQQPRFDTLLEVQNFQADDIESNQIRRVCSTGDLPKIGMKQQQQQTTCTQQTICSSSPLSGEGSNFIEEANFKVGRYNAEERKERIDRYRAKRTQRNFNKTIKYACRKTLADNRPRIRGRFARNDETGEIPKPASSFNLPYNEDDDDLWVDNLQEEEEERILGRGGGRRFLTHFGATQFQYCRY